MNIRIGQGFDVHRLVPDRPLILGGVTIDFPLGLLGHSDADALLHAITDALLGASALGDIGTFFPDTDLTFKGANSRQLLRLIVRHIHQQGWYIVNVDSTLIAQQPKLRPYILAMRQNIADDLGLDIERVSVKGKTNEELGYLGEMQAIEARAVVLLARHVTEQ